MNYRTYLDMKIPELESFSNQELIEYIESIYEKLYRLGKNYNEVLNTKINPLLMQESIKIMTFDGVIDQEAQNAIMQIQMDYFSPTDLPYQQIIVNESYQDIDFAFKRFLMGLKEIDAEVFQNFFTTMIDYYIAISLLNQMFGNKQLNYINELIDNLTY
jgi:hypothetical protein